MYAMLVTVDIDAKRVDESDQSLHEFTIPTSKEQPGFVRGMWLRSADNSQGRGIVLFDTEDNANACAVKAQQGPPADAPIKIRSVDIFEVVAEA